MTHLNVIWLRSRKCRSSAQEASQRWPTTIARGGGGSAAMPCSPPDPPIRSARQPADLLGDLGLHGRDGVVVVRLDPHDARLLRRAEPDRETRSRA